MIEDELIHRVFLLPEGNDRDIEELLKWNKSNKPPMSIMKGQLHDYLCERNSLLEQSAAIADKVLGNLLRNRANVSILRAYINLLKENREVTPEESARMLALWKQIPMDCLEMFVEAFNLSAHITPEMQQALNSRINEFVAELVKAQRFQDCLKLLKIFGKQDQHIKEVLGSMCTNQWVGMAANAILKLGLQVDSYPDIAERLAKKCMRHFLKRQGWHYVEELYHDKPVMLAAAVEDLIHDKKINEALTIFTRHLHGREELLRKEDIKKVLQTQLQKEFKVMDNPLAIDNFGPTDPAKQLSLVTDFGIAEDAVIMLDDNHPELEQHLRDLFSERMLGFDTESLVGLTKLEQETDGLALIQAANSKRVYLFDCARMKSPLIAKYFKEYFQGDGLKLGHAVVADLRAICVQLGIPKIVERVIDTWHIFKGLHPEQKHSNLSHICRKLLGKEICKAQTLTDWRRRPLRRNQKHYAAMDAYVVVRIYQRLLDQYGEQYLSHFIEEDELRQQIEFS